MFEKETLQRTKYKEKRYRSTDATQPPTGMQFKVPGELQAAVLGRKFYLAGTFWLLLFFFLFCVLYC
jgi:hypothetical protein